MARMFKLTLSTSKKMGHSKSTAVAMDDLDNDIKRTMDDAVDDAESLPFRYVNDRGSVC
jgi:hypothetical protein